MWGGGRHGGLRVPSPLRGIGHGHDMVGLELTGELVHQGDTVVTTPARAPQGLAPEGNLLHHARIALGGQRHQGDGGFTVALIEPADVMVTVPPPATPASPTPQSPRFGSHDERVPIDQIQAGGGLDEEVPGVEVAVTQAGRTRLVDQQAGELCRACDEMVTSGVLGLEHTGEVGCNGILTDVSSPLPEESRDPVAPHGGRGLVRNCPRQC
jgi:hypothetical protein